MSTSRKRLIDGATELFLGGGFHNIGIAEICEKASVNKGTFYHFFPSKLDLLLEVIKLYVEDMVAKFAEIAASEEVPTQKLRHVFQVPQRRNEAWKAVHGVASGCFLGNVILELSATEPVVRETAKWALEAWARALEPILQEFLKAEGIKNLDAASAAEVVIGIVQGAHVIAKVKNDPKVLGAFGQMAVEMLRAAGNPR
ncbi:MAG: hypothetical protein CTY20_13175 [Hyphomicrobium sp.]|nr:MAG: hypothetical protein CTY20_13175 [Hyphomicrobium sp.]